MGFYSNAPVDELIWMGEGRREVERFQMEYDYRVFCRHTVVSSFCVVSVRPSLHDDARNVLMHPPIENWTHVPQH